MLIIRNEQLQIFSESVFDQCMARLCSDLRRQLLASGDYTGESDLRRWAEEAAFAAVELGFTEERHVAGFMRAVVSRWGIHRLRSLPKVAVDILGAYGVAPERRLALLEAWLHDIDQEGFVV